MRSVFECGCLLSLNTTPQRVASDLAGDVHASKVIIELLECLARVTLPLFVNATHRACRGSTLKDAQHVVRRCRNVAQYRVRLVQRLRGHLLKLTKAQSIPLQPLGRMRTCCLGQDGLPRDAAYAGRCRSRVTRVFAA